MKDVLVILFGSLLGSILGMINLEKTLETILYALIGGIGAWIGKQIIIFISKNIFGFKNKNKNKKHW